MTSNYEITEISVRLDENQGLAIITENGIRMKFDSKTGNRVVSLGEFLLHGEFSKES